MIIVDKDGNYIKVEPKPTDVTEGCDYWTVTYTIIED